MCKRFGSVVVLLAAMLGWMNCGTPAVAQLLSSFENDLSMNGGDAIWELGPTYEYTDVGATDGTSALEFHHRQYWGDGSYVTLKGGLPLAQLVASNDFMLFDATTQDIGVAGDGLAPNFRQVFIIYNSSSGGWQQSAALDIPVAADDGGSITNQVTLDLTAGLSANAQAFVDSGGVDGYWEVFFVFQGSDLGPVAGDYNNDGDRSAADYTVWRNSLGDTILTNETASPGIVDQADYDEWKSNFGIAQVTTIIDNIRFVSLGSGGLSGAAVPEPSSAVLALCAALAVAAARRKRERMVN